VENGTVKTN